MADKFEQVDPAYLEDPRNAKESKAKADTALSRTATESAKVAREQMHNLIAMAMKDYLFNKQAPEAAAAAAETGEDLTSSMAAHAIKMAQEMEEQGKVKAASSK